MKTKKKKRIRIPYLANDQIGKVVRVPRGRPQEYPWAEIPPTGGKIFFPGIMSRNRKTSIRLSAKNHFDCRRMKITTKTCEHDYKGHNVKGFMVIAE